MSLYRKFLHAAVMRAEINEQLGRYDEALKELDHLSSFAFREKKKLRKKFTTNAAGLEPPAAIRHFEMAA